MLHSSVKCTFFHCFWLLGHYFLQKLGFFFIVHKYPSISWLDFFICSSVNWTWIQPLSLKIYRLLHIDNKKAIDSVFWRSFLWQMFLVSTRYGMVLSNTNTTFFWKTSSKIQWHTNPFFSPFAIKMALNFSHTMS